MKPFSILCFALTLLSFSLVAPPSAIAGKYADAFSKCISTKVTKRERKTLNIWIFWVTSLNPEVSEFVKISPAQRTKINMDVAKVFENLITQTCKSEAQKVFKHEGLDALGNSFSALGEAVGNESISAPESVKGIGEFANFIDEKKLNSIFNQKK